MIVSNAKLMFFYLTGLLTGFLLTLLCFPSYDVDNNKLSMKECHCDVPKLTTEKEAPTANVQPLRHSKERRAREERIDGIRKNVDITPTLLNSSTDIAVSAYNDVPTTVADELSRRVRIFCWILTGKDTHQSRAVPVKETWARRCNKFVFISSRANETLPAISLNISEGRNHLWGKTKAAFKYAYDNHLDDFDWFLKADDDTFVIMENLRFLLLGHSAEEPIYFGCKFNSIVKQGYMSGGAGYVLSRSALKLFVERGMHNGTVCRQAEDGAEDAELGLCMERLNVRAGDSRDPAGRHRFFPFTPDHHLPPGEKTPGYWFWKSIFDPMEQGPGCCSDFSVSFHYVSPAWMYALDFLVYRLRPFGHQLPFSAPIMDGIVAMARANRGPTDVLASWNGTHWLAPELQTTTTVQPGTVSTSTVMHATTRSTVRLEENNNNGTVALNRTIAAAPNFTLH